VEWIGGVEVDVHDCWVVVLGVDHQWLLICDFALQGYERERREGGEGRIGRERRKWRGGVNTRKS
jgi:hypothetical protein